ncbi:hypothetical protein HDF10_000032 [Edaphobacter lichenicola]|uniref:Uncharacterized protein n=1 Tax=Tunturiibacter lichenicola TaxID=2051959 RepID=A0A7W8J3W3_9BACT|nr:hypothetical protein [Edaphobacter lichenicola]
MALFSSLLLLAQEKPAGPPAINSFPDSDFTLRDHGVNHRKVGSCWAQWKATAREELKAPSRYMEAHP